MRKMIVRVMANDVSAAIVTAIGSTILCFVVCILFAILYSRTKMRLDSTINTAILFGFIAATAATVNVIGYKAHRSAIAIKRRWVTIGLIEG